MLLLNANEHNHHRCWSSLGLHYVVTASKQNAVGRQPSRARTRLVHRGEARKRDTWCSTSACCPGTCPAGAHRHEPQTSVGTHCDGKGTAKSVTPQKSTVQRVCKSQEPSQQFQMDTFSIQSSVTPYNLFVSTENTCPSKDTAVMQ